MVADVDPDTIELLDYEDDLSMEGDNDEYSPIEEQPKQSEPCPGMSAQECGPDEILTEQLSKHTEEKLLNNPVIQQLMKKQMAQEKQDLINNPAIQNMMESFFENKFKDMNTTQTEQPKQQAGMNMVPNQRVMEVNRGNQGVDMIKIANNETNHNQIVHSPSDITVYTPALQKRLTPQHDDMAQVVQNMGNFDIRANIVNTNNGIIGDFVESVRQQQHPVDFEDNRRNSDVAVTSKLKEAQIRADKALLEAECFKAQIEPPGNHNVMGGDNVNDNTLGNDRELIVGVSNPNNGNGVEAGMQILNIGSGVSDDDFFHLTCHIDPNLIHRIEKGEFVELEKLLPKDKLGKNGEDNRLEWIQRDGGTYLVPAQRDSKISSFRRCRASSSRTGQKSRKK